MYRFSTVPVFYVHVALFVKKFRTREKIWFWLMFQTVCCFLGLFFLDIVIDIICVCILTCQRDSDSGKQLEENPTEDLLQLFVNLCIYSFLEIDTRLLIWQLWSLVRLCFYVEKIVVSISIAKKISGKPSKCLLMNKCDSKKNVSNVQQNAVMYSETNCLHKIILIHAIEW